MCKPLDIGNAAFVSHADGVRDAPAVCLSLARPLIIVSAGDTPPLSACIASLRYDERTRLPSVALDRGGRSQHLQLRSNPPQYVYSTAPLTASDGTPVAAPTPGAGGHSLALHDRQVLMHPNFRDFPTTAITVEFWMYSVDTCRPGVPFSYAAGERASRRRVVRLLPAAV